MTLKSVGLVVASFVLASALYGCATSDHTSGSRGTTKVTEDNEFCTWTFSRDNATGKVVAATLTAATKPGYSAGTCRADESEHTLFISDKDGKAGSRVLDFKTPAEFTLEGEKRSGGERLLTCRYCYVNSAGGISCIYYPC